MYLMKEKRKNRKKETFAKRNTCQAPCNVLLRIPGRCTLSSELQAPFTKFQIHKACPAKQSHRY